MARGGQTYRRFTARDGANHIHPMLILHALEIEAARWPDPANNTRGPRHLVWTERMQCRAMIPLRVVEHESWHPQPHDKRGEDVSNASRLTGFCEDLSGNGHDLKVIHHGETK